jgi:hypothetical protein
MSRSLYLSLMCDPKKADTLFDLGIVKWHSRKDRPGAIAAWKKLPGTNPTYRDKGCGAAMDDASAAALTQFPCRWRFSRIYRSLAGKTIQ